MVDASPLDQQVTLADIIDPAALARVCRTYSQLFATGVAVFDAQGETLVEAGSRCLQVSSPRKTDLLQKTGVPAEHCMRAVLREQQRGATANVQGSRYCGCGLAFELMPIEYQGELLGHLVYGPYAPLDDRTSDAPAMRADGQRQEEAATAVRALDELLSVIVQTGYARHLTSQIHIAAIQDAYNELTEKNRRLADSVEKLKELDRMKSSFLATVSHELRTPLTSVIGYSEMLLEGIAGEVNEKQCEYLQTIMRKGDHLLQLINEILDLSKTESGRVQLSYESVDLNLLLREVLNTMVPQARRKKIVLEAREHDSRLFVSGDRGKLRQVMLNLLSNAIKFTPERGTVTATVTKSTANGEGIHPVAEIRIEDTGIGVPHESRERIFEAFFQVDSSSTRTYGGAGLGLSLVKHFVEAHGGEIWFEEPASCSGSVFVVQIPLNGAPSAQHTSRQSAFE